MVSVMLNVIYRDDKCHDSGTEDRSKISREGGM
jgi:hypothetical protein